ncbi:MAG: DUF58 domain-containing protein [Novosphingobium sp.]
MAFGFPRILPTARAAVLIALAAPLALVIAAIAPSAWIVAPALGGTLLLLVLLDALIAGSLVDLRVLSPSDSEIGAPLQLTVLADIAGGAQGAVAASLALDPRLAAGGRCDLALGFDPASASWQGNASLTPSRRGQGVVETIWLRWTGPFRLGARMAKRELGQTIRVWPNISEVRSPALQSFLRDAQTGLIARRIRGEGTQFEALSEYQAGMERRRIDWKSSARHVRLFAREFETERNNQIVFAFDCGQAMCEPLAGMPRIDRAVSAALLTSYVALKSGDRVALFGFAARPEVMTPFISDTRLFHRLQSEAARLDYHAQEPNFTLALATLASRLQRRSLIVVFSDFTDPTSAELMIESIGRLVAKHVVLFVTLADEELEDISTAEPGDMQALAMAVSADSLLRQRALVTRRLQQLGVDVIEAPWNRIGTRLIDAYLSVKRMGAIG